MGIRGMNTDLHVDMAFIVTTEIAIIRDNPAIGNRGDLTPK